MQKYIRYALFIVLLLPPLIGSFFGTFSISTASIGGLIFFIIIPIIGLFSKKTWFFYYVYIGETIVLSGLVFGAMFFSAFVDTSSLLFWPALWIVSILVLTIALHRNYLSNS